MLRGGAVISTVTMPAIASSWVPQGLVDVDGDGDKDVLYSNSSGGQWVLSLQNGIFAGGVQPASTLDA